MSSPKIAVAQLGARKHYQEPVLFHQWGILDTLYTDFYAGDRWPMQLLRNPKVQPFLTPLVKRMSDRYDINLNKANIVHFPLLSYLYTKKLKKSDGQRLANVFNEIGQKFCQQIINHGLGQANTVYGFNSACLELFQEAKSQGMRCILDQTQAEKSYAYQLIQAEEERWPNWSENSITFSDSELELCQRQTQEQNLADQIICGSDFVKESLINQGINANKIYVVPLGRVKSDLASSATTVSNADEIVNPWKKRRDGLHILFAGSVGLRKGIPYLLEALTKIKNEIPFVCKIAGSLDIPPATLSDYQGVCEILGRVPRSEMASLYSWADVFVLPSICEGSAMVIYEALQYGLPVITTHHAGSIIRDGLGGWIVPIRSSDAIANALTSLFEQGYEANFITKLNAHYQEAQTRSRNKFKQVILSEAPEIKV